jgi:endonuclease/exonuclease/phosphatase family metal-dependent hydrolase
MLTLLSWNIGRRSIADRVARIARGRDADIVALAECAAPNWVTRRLNESTGARYFPANTRSRLTIYTRFMPNALATLSETNYYSIRELRAVQGIRDSLIIVTAHLPSKLEVSDHNQIPDAVGLSQAVAAAEDQLGHTRTVLLGDLNMNPFEFGASAGAALHGVMTRDIARLATRTVRERTYRFFYNPMWRFFGDGTPGPPGTYFYWRSDEQCYFWNVFDQAMIRPALLDRFAADGIEVLDSDGTDSLIGANGRPDTTRGSDHLPILLRLDV